MQQYLKRRGQALIEFVIIMPFLLFILVFAYYAFFIISDVLTLQQMGREAARLGAIDQQIAYLTNIDPQNTASQKSKQAQAQVLAEINRFGILHLYTLDYITVSVTSSGGTNKQQYMHAFLRMKRRPEVPSIDGLFAFFPKQTGIGSGFPPPEFVYEFNMRPQRVITGGYY